MSAVAVEQASLTVQELGIGPVAVADLVARVQAASPVLPFDESGMEFFADYAKRLSRAAGRDGAAQALAFWLRRAELMRMRDEFHALERPDAVLMPRGLTFHLPPANVDTIFVYSLALALLTGNGGIVRLSSRVLDQPNTALSAFLQTLKDHPAVAARTALVSYGHDQAITAALSAASDVRVIWGGDATIERIRQAPLPVHARDLAFADRASLSAVDLAAYEHLDEHSRRTLAERFYNDVYWFDQMGCSSPRCLIWVGEGSSEASSRTFHQLLQAVAEAKGYTPDASVEIGKLGYAYGSIIDSDVQSYTRFGAADTVLQTGGFPPIRGEFCGGGLLYQWQLPALRDLAPHVRRMDQTLAVFGFERQELGEFVSTVAGRGVDRIVPIGKALDFSRFWDGYDLLVEFTRRVAIDAGGGA